MIKNILIIGLFFVSNFLFSQEKNDEVSSFSLKQAQEYALQHNYKNKKALFDIDIAKKKVWETTAIGLPQVTAEVKLQNFIDLPTSLIPASSFNPSAPADELIGVQFGTDYNNTASITATQLLFDGSYIVGLQAAKTFKNLSINNQAKTEIELKEAVNQAYFTVLIAEENTAVLTKSLESVQSILKETEALYGEGLTEEQSVDQLMLSVNQLKTAVGVAKGQIRFARKLLKLQMGLDIATKITLTENLVVFIEEINPAPEQKEFNVKAHIDYTLIETNMELMKLNLRKEKYSFMPSLSLFFNHQQQNMSNDFDVFSGGKWYPSTIIGASLKLPILTSGSRLAKMSQAKIELNKSQITQKEVEQNLIYQSQLAKSGYDTNYEVYINQKENMALAKKIYDKTVKKYQEGVASSLELSQTQNQYLTVEGSYIKSLLDLLTAKSELQKSYGSK